MNKQEQRRVADLLKRSFAPVNRDLGRDLWPEMLRRLERPPVHVPWWDWALAGALLLCLLLFPEMIPAVLYQL